MIIYGVALLSACLVIGLYVGEALGNLIGVQANVRFTPESGHCANIGLKGR